MKSLWQATVRKPSIPSLEGDMSTDVLIIGGGAVGILTAYYLKQAGVDCLVAEAERVCGGVTGLTTAKITVQHGLCYDAMSGKYGEDFARDYYLANTEALESYRRLADKYDFDLRRESNFVYSTADFSRLEREKDVLSSIGAPAELHRLTPLPVQAVGMVEVKDQYSMHPLKLFYALAAKLNIVENAFVRKLEGTEAVTDRGRIRAKRVVVATHFPFINSHGMYYAKLYQHRSYVLALAGGPRFGGMYVDEAMDGFSFRNWEDYAIIGGGDHKTGEKGGGWEVLYEFTRRHYPEARPICHWATQDCMSLDGVPYIGRYSPNTPGIYVATGFNKWGMSSSMVAARLLTEELTGKESRFAEVFSPQRDMLHFQLLKNGAATAKELLRPAVPRCPHMGCALKWNDREGTWDCPCHGSRFDENGALINGPALKDCKGACSVK